MTLPSLATSLHTAIPALQAVLTTPAPLRGRSPVARLARTTTHPADPNAPPSQHLTLHLYTLARTDPAPLIAAILAWAATSADPRLTLTGPAVSTPILLHGEPYTHTTFPLAIVAT